MSKNCGYTLRICGTVQGVGFRPFIWQLAQDFDFVGRVFNDSHGVVVEVYQDHQLPQRFEEETVNAFIAQIHRQLPPLAKITELNWQSCESDKVYHTFEITQSAGGEMKTQISPDIATCPQCLDEMNNSQDRRYRYPFINCTHCGPRLSIIKAMPYDRPKTSMASFPLCPECQSEYDNPADRRFHAQPTACPACGPSLTLTDNSGTLIIADEINETVRLLKTGKIVAIKGIGGFHLACDATNRKAVAKLRARKNRPDKPFALMAHMSILQQICQLNPAEREMLCSTVAPIVLAEINESTVLHLADNVAPGQRCLGVMAPANPLQHLLLTAFDGVLVMTSGNSSGLPPCTDNAQALSELSNIADYFLLHNRDIVNRLDDSIMRQVSLPGGSYWQTLRRARGLVPEPIHLDPAVFSADQAVLAMGADLKNTFCLLKDNQAIVSQHLGDLDNVRVFNEYLAQLDNYQQLFNVKPQVVVSDCHPGYQSQKAVYLLADNTRQLQVQHHVAHVRAVMAEHGVAVDKKVLALALDGLGFGDAAKTPFAHELWGGELLEVSYGDYQWLNGLEPIAMPGGNMASREPWRNAVAQVVHFLPDELALLIERKIVNENQLNLTLKMLEKSLNCPKASSAGRLFDAVAALLGLAPEKISYEGQAAVALENAAWIFLNERGVKPALKYADHTSNQLNLIKDLVKGLKAGIKVNQLAFQFHQQFSQMCVNFIQLALAQSDCDYLILTGGVCQNRLILTLLNSAIHALPCQLLLPEKLPVNDGGIALGQAVSALSLK